MGVFCHDNGVIVAPSCVIGCYLQGHPCNHETSKLQLNKCGDYVVFPSSWLHCGYCYIASKTSNDHAIFNAQFFASPRPDITSKSSQMTSHLLSNFDPTKLHSLIVDLLYHQEDKYGEDEFPPAAKLYGKVDKLKNRHILRHQMKKVPMIEKLVSDLEDRLTDVTIDSVWLVKKTKKDVPNKVWHTNTIGKTIVMNLGFGISTEVIDEVKTVVVGGHGEH